jgi:DNA-binding transcriptional LysR family regulator
MFETMNERRPSITIDQLYTFIAVAGREHVTRAAEAIHLSQGTVSYQVQLLERTLGVQLLERMGRRVRLTSTGREIARVARSALSAVRAVEEVAAAARGLEIGSLEVAANVTTGVHRLPTWIAAFLRRHPAIDIRLRLDSSEGAVRQVENGDVDCAVVEGPFSTEGVRVLCLERDELVMVVASSHPLAQVSRLDTHALEPYRYLSRRRRATTETLAVALLGRLYGCSPTLELGQVDAIRAGVLAGLGYAVLPRAVVARDVAMGRIAVLPTRTGPVYSEFRAVRRTGRGSPAQEAFWRYLERVAARDGSTRVTGRGRVIEA